MRALLSLMLLTVTLQGCQLPNPDAPEADVNTLIPPVTKPNFATEIKPIFQARCQPCHFQGGKVYDKMPFDKPETINRLGAKLFTRIKEEKERQIITEFLAQP